MPDFMAHAVVVAPGLAARRLGHSALRRWLQRAAVRRERAPDADVARVLRVLGRPPPTAGLAALRLWGQTGTRPSAWVAAADPAYLEARLDRVHIHDLPARELPRGDLAPLFEDLQRALFADDDLAIARVGTLGYLSGGDDLDTAALPASLIDGERLDAWLPQAAARVATLVSETQMFLHGHPVNAARTAAGRRPVNALWIWGGGYAPPVADAALPPLYSDDPLLCGVWLAGSGRVAAPPGSLAECMPQDGGGFVATLPEDLGDTALCAQLLAARDLLQRRCIARLTLLLRDGIVVEFKRGDGWRLWRANAASILGPAT